MSSEEVPQDLKQRIRDATDDFYRGGPAEKEEAIRQFGQLQVEAESRGVPLEALREISNEQADESAV